MLYGLTSLLTFSLEAGEALVASSGFAGASFEQAARAPTVPSAAVRAVMRDGKDVMKEPMHVIVPDVVDNVVRD